MWYEILWRFIWKSDEYPIIEGNAESADVGSMNLILRKSLEVIEVAREFGGVPYSEVPSESSQKFALRISFSLLFPSDDYANEFLIYLDSADHI